MPGGGGGKDELTPKQLAHAKNYVRAFSNPDTKKWVVTRRADDSAIIVWTPDIANFVECRFCKTKISTSQWSNLKKHANTQRHLLLCDRD